MNIMNVLIISAHPDDEVLGMGGTIKKMSKQGHNLHLCVVTEGASAQYLDKKMIEVRKNSCVKAGEFLGISSFNFLDFPDMGLEAIPRLQIIRKLENIIKKINPEIIFTTPKNDLHLDHKLVHESTVIACRPTKNKIEKLLCYEIPSPLINQFNPNIYENIELEIEDKINSFQFYESEIEEFPHPRSIESIRAFSKVRGVQSGFKNAEGFSLIQSFQN
jgi:N-acetylglucosamine malate deacetylase 1